MRRSEVWGRVRKRTGEGESEVRGRVGKRTGEGESEVWEVGSEVWWEEGWGELWC